MSDTTRCFQLGDRVWAWGSGAFARSVLLVVFAGFLDLVVLQSVTGASIGKLCTRLRVVEVRGNEARFLRVLGRWLFLVVDLGCLVVGVVSTLVTHPHRRVGDLVCGTYVVGVASVGQPVVAPPPASVYDTVPPAYAAPVGAPPPPGWGTPGAFPTIPASAPVETPPGTSPTTPGEWGAVARSAPVVRAPKWEAPPTEQAVPVARDTMAPQWAAPPGPKSDSGETEQHGAAEPMPAPEAAPEPLAKAPQWSPIVPLTDNGGERIAESSSASIQPPPPPPSPWRPIVPLDGDPTPSPAPPPTPPAPPPPSEPSPPPPTEPPPPAPTAGRPDPEPVATEPEPEDDVPWWDAEPSDR
jgi:hypothetical protein